MYRFLIIVTFLAGLVSSATVMAGQDDKRLDPLFSQLRIVKNPSEAKILEGAIWRIWIESSDQKVGQFLSLGIRFMNAGDFGPALNAFNEVTRLAPEFAEGWNKRATINFLLKDYTSSVRDIAQTLRLEPRHFGALSGLGLINAAIGRDQAAVKAFEQALAINPHMPGARLHVKELKKKLEGEET